MYYSQLLLSMFLIHMFIQQVFRSTPSFAFRANEKLGIARRVAIPASVCFGQDRPSYVRIGLYIGIRRSHAMFYSSNFMSSQ